MRLWSLHPKYLDTVGLVALWREALLAQAVLRGATRGYRRHPQLIRFREQQSPVGAIAEYLRHVHAESVVREFEFTKGKISRACGGAQIGVSRGQLDFEWQHLLRKLRVRAPDQFRLWRGIERPSLHPSFRLVAGGVASWERPRTSSRRARGDPT